MTIDRSNVENVLPQLLAWSQQGLAVCLATLYHADGGAPRPLGSQMAIAEDGQWFGYLSGGCAEQAIADEGVNAIKSERSYSVRYGLGSPYLDIQLPCGAGIDVWFEQGIQTDHIVDLLNDSVARKVVGLEFSTIQESPLRILRSKTDRSAASSIEHSHFERWYLPQRRLNIIGAGPNVTALTKLAQHADYQVTVLTPDAQTLGELKENCVPSHPNTTPPISLLTSHAQIEHLECDSYTAVVLMFHEHERETKILQHMLKSQLAYIGALGSRRAHAIRLEGLLKLGFTAEQCERIHGPIGLDIQAKTPSEIAVSVLAQLTRVFQARSVPLLNFPKTTDQS